MSNKVIDSSAILALINKESGWEKVADIIENSYLSTVNYSEIIDKLLYYKFTFKEIQQIFDKLKINVINFDRSIALETAKLKKLTKQYGLSLGDRACIATALLNDSDIVTADKIWLKLKLPVKIISIR